MTLSLPPDLFEVPTAQGFRIGLYLEHLEEAASLWEQRPEDRINPDLSWQDLGDDEARIEPHLDALVLGGDLALAVCRQQAIQGDAGERHAALRVFCRQNRPDLVQTAVEATDPDDELALDGVAEALAAEMPTAWEAGVWPRAADPRWLRVAAALVARQTDPAQAQAGWGVLRAALPEASGPVRHLVVRALGRVPGGISEPSLGELLRDSDAATRLEAGIALLRAGTTSGQALALAAVRDDLALVPLLGLAGRASAVPWLSDRLADGVPGAARALGLLGYASSVPPLIVALDGDDPDAAARALTVLTGAALDAETFVPDVPEPDERFDDEVIDGERLDPAADGDASVGVTPEDTAPIGTFQEGERGTTIVGPSTDPEAWAAWWRANEPALDAGMRYRLGWPAGPAAQVASLASPRLTYPERSLAADELVIRYRMPTAFDAGWSVARQLATLAEMRAWAEAQAFVPGRAYVGGHYAE